MRGSAALLIESTDVCGIAGQVRLREGPPIDRASIARMADCLAHRGPDASGVYVDPQTGGCGLGHRRLSIIDLAGGQQPMAGAGGRIWVSFNGEIYNFQELRASLESQGHIFKTRSDTEVLIHLWERHGAEMVGFLNGMFAFAIWDEVAQVLFLAVDRLGKKPLYFGEAAGIFRFGSEMKAILSDADFPRDVDPQALMLYLTFGYVPHPWSIFKGIRKLAPGHWALVKNGAVREQRYWEPPREVTYRGTFDEASQELRGLLMQATRSRLMTDVPLGAFLSGGIDSTIVVGLMSQMTSQPVKTFTIGFEEKRYDESGYARRVSERFGTDHHEAIVRPDAAEMLLQLARHFDEPFADSSAIPTYYVSQLARQHVTVALTGDGGDEAFGGYRRYRAGKLFGWANAFPGGRRLLGLGRWAIPASVDRTTNLGRARRIFDSLAGSAADSYLSQMTQFDDASLAMLVSPELAAGASADVARTWFASHYEGDSVDAAPRPTRDPAAAAMDIDLRSYLPGDILTKVDRASMACSLECRSPLLDHRVIEFACRLPTAWRLRGLSGHKYILKHAMADLLPREVVSRPKTGFAIPLADWLRGPLRPMLRDLLLSPRARQRGYFDAAVVQRLVDEHLNGQKNHATPLWLLLTLEQWHQAWLP